MAEMKEWYSYLMLMLKGMLMGAADIVPGVSGGTVAFMTGIYEELIDSISKCGPQAVKLLFSKGVKAAWVHVNGGFLATLVLGIVLSIALISRAVLYLLETYPVHLWALFFGLILSSTFIILRMIPRWSSNTTSSALVGMLIAYIFTSMVPIQLDVNLLTVFFAGAIAICAMILPGVSGSFLLLIMGMYSPILVAVKNVEVMTLLVFVAGCLVGLLSFSRFLHWMFKCHHHITLALLAGFMLGSLNKVWPWKYTTAYTIDRHGKDIPLVQENVWPNGYEALSGDPSFAVSASMMMLLGIVLVVIVERRSRRG